MADEEIEIEIVDEVPAAEEAEIEIVKADELEKPVTKTVDDELADLKKRLDTETQGRIDAEKRAHDAQGSVAKAQTEVRDSELGQISAAIETVKQNIEIQKVNYRTARSSDDIDGELTANTEIAKASAILMQLEQGKQALEAAPKIEAPAPYRPSDPVEALAQQLSPRSAQWVREHPEFARDTSKYQMMIAAHQLAVGRGISADSDDYFDSIETTLAVKRPQQQEESAMSDAAKSVQRRAAPAAAPVSRGGDGGGSNNKNTVRLTAAQIEAAASSGLTPQEYAKQLQAIEREREGRLN